MGNWENPPLPSDLKPSLVSVGLLSKSFYFVGSKLVRSLAETEHTKRKLLNFIVPSHQEMGINLEGKMPENSSY